MTTGQAILKEIKESKRSIRYHPSGIPLKLSGIIYNPFKSILAGDTLFHVLKTSEQFLLLVVLGKDDTYRYSEYLETVFGWKCDGMKRVRSIIRSCTPRKRAKRISRQKAV